MKSALTTGHRAAVVLLLPFLIAVHASAESNTKRQLDGNALSIAAQDLMPRGESQELELPATLDLADRARLAVAGLTNFLDSRNSYGEFGHGFFCTNPPYMVRDRGQSQNWGKIVEGMILMRQMSGSDVNLDIELASITGMMDYALLKMQDPYPVPLARMTMALIALHRQHPDPTLAKAIGQYRDAMIAKIQVDDERNQAYFGDANRRWSRDDVPHDMGDFGYSLQMFTAGTILRALVMVDQLPEMEVDRSVMLQLRNALLEPTFWKANGHPVVVVSEDNAQFTGHTHSYTQAMLGLAYYAHHTGDPEAMAFVRKGYEYLRTYGLSRIGLFGEGCTVGDMTYLAVRLSQWGAGDYWDDVDQYTRNQLTELQITDTSKIEAVSQEAPRMADITLADWAQDVEDKNVLERCRGIFLTDATHPTLIPLRREHVPDRSCMQWVVCCSGNCSKAMHVVWDSIVEYDDATHTATVNLLLNRASPAVDVISYLPNEGRVAIRNKQAETLLVRFPLWVDKQKVRCDVSGSAAPISWTGNFALLAGLRPDAEVRFEFPVVETVEKRKLAWQEDQMWQEGSQPPPSWPKAAPKEFTMLFRGNTLLNIEPRDRSVGIKLYEDRNGEKLRAAPDTTSATRFIYLGD